MVRISTDGAIHGAVLGTKLQEYIKFSYTFLNQKDVTFWIDSQVVLYWINNKSENYKPFVSHKIQVTKSSSDTKNWGYIPSNLNVADDATKRKSKLDISNSCRWLEGPDFFKKPYNRLANK